MEWKEYRYFDKSTVGLAFEGMLEDINAAPEGSVIVLHGARARGRALGADALHCPWQCTWACALCMHSMRSFIPH